MAFHRVAAASVRRGSSACPLFPFPLTVCCYRKNLPKNCDLSGVIQEELDAIARKLNSRSRKSLGFRCPAGLFTQEAI